MCFQVLYAVEQSVIHALPIVAHVFEFRAYDFLLIGFILIAIVRLRYVFLFNQYVICPKPYSQDHDLMVSNFCTKASSNFGHKNTPTLAINLSRGTKFIFCGSAA